MSKAESMKVKLRLVPKDQASREEVTSAGHKSVLDVTLKIKKPWTSVLDHIVNKWNKLQLVQKRLDLTLAKDGGAATDIMWGANLNDPSYHRSTVENILMREQVHRLALFEASRRPPGSADSTPLVIFVYSFLPQPAAPPPAEASFNLPPGFSVMGDSWLQAYSSLDNEYRATEAAPVSPAPLPAAQHSMDWITSMGSQLSLPASSLPGAPLSAPSTPIKTPIQPNGGSNDTASTEVSSTPVKSPRPADQLPRRSPAKLYTPLLLVTPSKSAISSGCEGSRSGRKHVRFAGEDEAAADVQLVTLTPSKRQRVEEIATAHAVLHGHVYSASPQKKDLKKKSSSSNAWASFSRAGRSRPELKRIRPTLVDSLLSQR